ncbi:peptide/nickel transport system ATP-binding protein [Arboricoccus pini]|uniref:Peptide/nickel transport system ATP-binding protein n=1 Tax=Arboricoccus pini TaxID=1963835 RepID=A0A212R8W6_9PROT|nr:ABC transporter ATP-binding protein [Arboricoccus pini]SNB68676.1 peptide/nickel transport system ATP-binding protein [Arboricoccus pini]
MSLQMSSSAVQATSRPLVELEDFSLWRQNRSVLDGLSFTLPKGQNLALVGESGAGKSTIGLALMGLLQSQGVKMAGRARFDGQDLVSLNARAWNGLRGRRLGMIFQDAGAALDPCFTIGHHLAFPLRRLLGLSSRQATERALALLESVGINDAKARLKAYPHELSGGMQQRVMIGIALACEPDLLIADEPTSALDVTIQAQIVRLIQDRVRMQGASCIFVLHDLALASQACERIVVLYAGQVMEAGLAEVVLGRSRHPYTQALKSCVIELDTAALEPPPGAAPSLDRMPSGCRFAPRCPRASERCTAEKPPLQGTEAHQIACWHPG